MALLIDVHPRAEMCDHGVVVVNLGPRPVSDNLACSLKIGVDLVYVHQMGAILLSERAQARRTHGSGTTSEALTGVAWSDGFDFLVLTIVTLQHASK